MSFQESYHRPLEHTPGNPTKQLWKGSLYSLLLQVYGCVPKVCWNNLRVMYYIIICGKHTLILGYSLSNSQCNPWSNLAHVSLPTVGSSHICPLKASNSGVAESILHSWLQSSRLAAFLRTKCSNSSSIQRSGLLYKSLWLKNISYPPKKLVWLPTTPGSGNIKTWSACCCLEESSEFKQQPALSTQKNHSKIFYCSRIVLNF